jgi:hypothetical protein
VMGVLWNLVSVCFKTMLVLVHLETVHGLCQTYLRLRNCFCMHPMVLLGDEAKVEAHFGLFGDTTNLDTR